MSIVMAKRNRARIKAKALEKAAETAAYRQQFADAEKRDAERAATPISEAPRAQQPQQQAPNQGKQQSGRR